MSKNMYGNNALTDPKARPIIDKHQSAKVSIEHIQPLN